MAGNSRFAVAIHTLAVVGYLSKSREERVSSLLIAKSVNTHAVVIRGLLQKLKKAGLVKSKEGKAGGVTLGRAPSRITLWDVLQAVEPSSLLKQSGRPVFKNCPVSRGMKKHLPRFFKEVDLAVAKTLRRRNLAEILDRISKV